MNFASNWHGFHQSYVIWEDVASRFECDFVLIGPASFQPRRDTEFNHTGLSHPYYLHARYVLDGPRGVRLVEVGGDTQRDRFDDYFRFLPRWRYLRYDRNPPPVLSALIPRDRTLANPFYYYSGTAEQESLSIYAELIRRIADSGAQVVVVHRDRSIVELADSLEHAHVVAASAFDQWLFPYRAPQGHNSAWANRIIAEQFLGQITTTGGGLSLVRFADVPFGTAPRRAAAAQTPARLSELTGIDARIGDQVVASLFTASRDSSRAGSPVDFKDASFVSLLLVKDPRIAGPDAAFLPLSFRPASGAAITVEGAGAGGGDLEIGRVRWLDPSGAIALAQLPGFEFEARRELRFHGSERLDLRALRWEGREVRIGGAAVLKGFDGGTGQEGSVVFYPVNGSLWKLAASDRHASDLDALPESGSLDLALVSDRETVRVPLSTWRKLDARMEVGARPLSRRLSKATHRLASAIDEPQL